MTFPLNAWLTFLPWKVGILWHCFASQLFENYQMSSLVLQGPVKVKKERGVILGAGRAQDTLLLPSTCRTGQSSVLLCGSFQVNCEWGMFVLHKHQLSIFRNIGRAENYQHLSNLVCSPTAKHGVFIWNGGSLTAAENTQVFPVAFRYIIVICQTEVRKFKCFEFIISHVHTDM